MQQTVCQICLRHTTTLSELSVHDMLPCPDPETGHWKRSRPEHAASSARPAKDSLDGEDHFLQPSKSERQVPQPRLLGRT